MKAMNIPSITLESYEADDILATLATQGEEAGFNVLVVSGDRDAFQLITDKTLVLYPKKGISDIPPMDADAVEAKYFVRPERYSDLAALVGETADNLPGVPGVGPKTAAKWINLYGDLAGILENAENIKGKVGEALREHVDNVTRNRRLNQLKHDLELPVTLEQMELQAPNREEIENLFDALEFNTLRKRLFDLFAAQEEEVAPEVAEFTRVVTEDAKSCATSLKPERAHRSRSSRPSSMAKRWALPCSAGRRLPGWTSRDWMRLPKTSLRSSWLMPRHRRSSTTPRPPCICWPTAD